MKDKIRQFIRERNKKLALKEKKRISANKTFRGMLAVRMLIGLVVFIIAVLGIRQYMLYDNAKNLDERYDIVNSIFLDFNTGDHGNRRIEWINSLDTASKVLASDYQNELGEMERDVSYWAVYDLENGNVLKDFSREHWFIEGYVKVGKEAVPVKYDVAPDQVEACRDVLSSSGTHISSFYLYNNYIYIHSYKRFYDATNHYVEHSDLLDYGGHYVSLNEFYDNDDNFFRESNITVGEDGGHVIAIKNAKCVYERNVSRKFINDGYNFLLKIKNKYHDGDGLTDTTHRFGLLSEKIIYSSVISTDAAKKYGMVWSVVNTIDVGMFFAYVGLTLLVIVTFVLLFTSVAYRKYKISHEIYMYRKALTNAMAHDLKSPLAAISGYAENMNAGSNPEKNDYYAEQIMNRTEYMNELIEKLLELSKTDELAVRSQDELEMVSTAEKLFASFSDQMEKRSISYNIEGSSVVMCDEVSMYTAIKNIIENAVKYCDDKGTISVSLSDDKLVFSNPYDGADNLDADRLVEAYIKGDEARSGAKGNGLGLAIVKNICDAHGFTLNVKAADDTFTVTINL